MIWAACSYLLSLIVDHNSIISLWANTFTDLCVQQWHSSHCVQRIEMVHKTEDQVQLIEVVPYIVTVWCFVALLIVVEMFIVAKFIWHNFCAIFFFRLHNDSFVFFFSLLFFFGFFGLSNYRFCCCLVDWCWGVLNKLSGSNQIMHSTKSDTFGDYSKLHF